MILSRRWALLILLAEEMDSLIPGRRPAASVTILSFNQSKTVNIDNIVQSENLIISDVRMHSLFLACILSCSTFDVHEQNHQRFTSKSSGFDRTPQFAHETSSNIATSKRVGVVTFV